MESSVFVIKIFLPGSKPEIFCFRKALDLIIAFPVSSSFLPIAFHFGAVLLDVSKFPTRIALLLICMVTITSQVARFTTVVAALLSLSLRLLAVLRNMAASTAVIAGFHNKRRKTNKTIKP